MSFHDEMLPLVERAAANTARKWPSYVSAEDVAQEIWIWVYSNQNSVENALEAGDWEAKVYSTMLKVASSAASKEDQESSGYSKEDTYVYSTEVLETLLESAFTYEDWQSFGTFGDGQPRAKGQVNETGDILAMLSDVKAGLADLSAQHREVLFYRFGLHWTHEQFAEYKGVSKGAANMKHKRAVTALRDILGRVNPADLREGWSRRREAIGNGHANAITDRQYEG